MKTKITSLARPVATSLLAGLLCCLPAGNPRAQIFIGGGGGAAASAATSFSGQATAVSGLALGNSLTLVNSGSLFVAGDVQEASSAGESVVGVFTTGVIHTSAVGQGNVAATECSVADLSVTNGGFVFAGGLITADFVMARATASCTATGATATGQVQITGLVINGQSIAVTGQANQTAFVDGNFVIINEQFVTQTATSANITVNALHIITSSGTTLIFASTSAGITCGTQTSQAPPCGDFVTGGGWIAGTPSGHKANFGVAGGIKNGAFWGHLNYKDHGNGMHVKATAVTGYAVDSTDPDCRIIDYTVTIDGQPGTARVRVCDKGEPGRNDIFQIQLSNGYSAGGDLGGTHPGGGNIQLHKCHD